MTSPSLFTRRIVVAAGAAFALVVYIAPSLRAAPSDPFATGLPSRETQAPEGLASGGAVVTESQGTAGYSVSIAVPPGRRGMQPHLSLDYSSDGAVRGGLAAGWSFQLPSIERDPLVHADAAYRMSLGGSPQVLIPSPNDGAGERYRAEWDDDFARVVHEGTTWTVRTPDGITRTFGGGELSTDGATIWHLTREVDPFGNQVDYRWDLTFGVRGHEERVLVGVDYTSNPGASLLPHARIDLVWLDPEYCGGGTIPKGAQVDHRFSRRRMTGSRRLTDVLVHVRDTAGGPFRQARQLHLEYDTSQLACASRAPTRVIAAVHEYAWNSEGIMVSAPAVTFTYGAPARTLGEPIVTNSLGERGGLANGPTRGYLDLDGDAVLDEVHIMTEQRCVLYWRKGLAGGGFEGLTRTTELPSARWGRQEGNSPESGDSCTLNRQMAFRGLRHLAGVCFADQVQVNYHFVDWNGDGLLDLLADVWEADGRAGGDFADEGIPLEENEEGEEPSSSCSFGQVEITVDGQPWCTCPEGTTMGPSGCEASCEAGFEGSGSDCEECGDGCPPPWDDPVEPPGGGGVVPCTAPQPVTGVSGVGYRWHVFLNQGAAFVDPTGANELNILSPRALPPNAGELTTQQASWPGLPTLIDVTGDGWLDVISRTPTQGQEEPPLGTNNFLYVWRGDGSETFPDFPETWSMTNWSQEPQATTMSGSPPILIAPSTAALQDFDGDHLPDLILQDGANHDLWLLSNSGDHFQDWLWLGAGGPPEGARVEPPIDWTGGWLNHGARAATQRLLDLDADGLPERITIYHGGRVRDPADARMVDRFYGDTRVSWGYLTDHWEGVEGLVTALTGAWQREHTVMDLTGDGRLEPVRFDVNGTISYRTDVPGDPPRLLTSINNGRGGTTRIYYKLASDPAVATGWRGDPRWVVEQVQVDPGMGQPVMTSWYRYRDAVLAPRTQAYPARPSFLGFGDTFIYGSGPSGSTENMTRRHFVYLGDGEAREALAVTTALLGSSWVAVNIVETAYQVGEVRGGRSRFAYPSTTTRRTCREWHLEEDCLAETELVTTTHSIWAPVEDSPGDVTLWFPSKTREGMGLDVGGSRAIGTDYELRLGDSDYRALPAETKTLVVHWIPLADGTLKPIYTPIGRTVITYDSQGLPFETAVYQDSDTAAVTRTYYDGSTGLPIATWRPNLVALNVPMFSWIIYDEQKLYGAHLIDEYSHHVFQLRDPATGALLQRLGPNSRTIQGALCLAPLCDALVYQPEEWSIDGFGRMTEHRVAVDPAGGPAYGYALAPIEWAEYHDAVVPNRIARLTLLDWGGSTSLDERLFDGAGRTIESISRSLSAEADTSTQYFYDAAGRVASVLAPDPGSAGGGQVSYQYHRDGLGRLDSLERPDGSTEYVLRVGTIQAVFSWDPVDGWGAPTVAYHDPWGRMVELHEWDNPEPGDIAVTVYEHDLQNRVQMISDADGATTQLTHDWAGNRTAVQRGARAWEYTYDLEGNVTHRLTPRPAGADPAQYTSETTYDWLGRVTSHTPAPRGMSALDRAQMGIGTVSYTYDVAENGAGRVAAQQLPFGATSYTYDLGGRTSRETRTLHFWGSGLPGLATAQLTQSVDRVWAPNGAPVSVTWDDGTSWSYHRDARNRLDEVVRHAPGGDVVLATFGRNAAGVARMRESALPAHRQREYDVLGRPVLDRVFVPGGNVLSDVTRAFDGQGQLRQVWGQVNGNLADASYEYDRRGRVISAMGPADYEGTFSYSASGNVQSVVRTWTLDTPGQSVVYEYGDVDPHAVDRLINTNPSYVMPEAQLTYDEAGNMIQRQIAYDVRTLTWDGDDQLRRTNGTWTGSLETYWFAAAGERVVTFEYGSVYVRFGESETRLSPYTGQQWSRLYDVNGDEPIARIHSNGTTELVFHDGLQSQILAVDQSGAVTGAFQYGAFGELVTQTGGWWHRERFNGKRVDVAGLRHYGFRSFDPAILRWISADPAYRFMPDAAPAAPQRANLYAFSLNNPLRYLDPDGLCPYADPLDCEEPPQPGANKSKGTIYIFDVVDDAKELRKRESDPWIENGTLQAIEGTISQIYEDAIGEPNAEAQWLRDAGYDVVWMHEVTWETFLALIAKDDTVGFILEAHGNTGAVLFDDGKGGDRWIHAGKGNWDQVKLGKNFKFGYFAVCETGYAEAEIRKAFDYTRAFGFNNDVKPWDAHKNRLHWVLQSEVGVGPPQPLRRAAEWYWGTLKRHTTGYLNFMLGR